MALRNYSNITNVGTLSGAVGTGETTLAINGGWANLPAFPFYIIVDRGAGTEECMLATGGNATALQVTRGYDGSPASSHGINATVEHAVLSEFFNKADQHVEASTNVHGLSGGAAVVGTTSTQTVTNKTLNSSIVNLAHSTSPAASQAVQVSADAATARDGFVWNKTAAATGAAFRAVSSGATKFTVDADGKVVLNSTTGGDKALAIQQSAADRLSVLNDGTVDLALQDVGTATDRVTIRSRPTQTPLRIRDAAAASVFSVGAAGNVDASGYVASAGAVSSGTTLTAGTNLTVNGTSTLTGDVTLPLPAAGTTQRLIINSRTNGTNIEGRNQAGTPTFYVRETGKVHAHDKVFIHNGDSPAVAKVGVTGDVPSPTDNMVVWDHSSATWKRYDGSTWVELQPHLLARQAAAQSIPNNTFTTLTGLTEDLDTHAAFNATTGVFTVPTGFGGWYEMGGGVGFDVNSTGQRGLRWVKNGSEINGSSSLLDAAAGGNSTMIPSRTILVNCAVGDTLALQGIQNSGGSLNTTSAGSQQSTVYIKRVLGA